MKFLTIILLCACMSFYACQEAVKTAGRSCNLTGRYLNRTVLDKCPGTMPVDIPSYALELIFEGKDSVAISNGIEKYSLPYVATGNECEFKITGATQFGDMIFSVAADSSVIVYDSAWTDVSTPSVFKIAGSSVKRDWDFENFLNECVIAGTYVTAQENKPESTVVFLPNGQVTGLKNFLSYKLCYAGDCLEETETPSNTIEFINNKGASEIYVYKMPDGNRIVQFYSIGDPIPDIKGGRSIGPMAFEVHVPKATE